MDTVLYYYTMLISYLGEQSSGLQFFLLLCLVFGFSWLRACWLVIIARSFIRRVNDE